MAAPQLVEFVAKALVDHPDQVSVVVTQEAGATVIELRVAEDDMGKVIGRNAAAAYLSVYLEADPGIVPPLARGSYYWHELMGCPVVDPDGEPLGTVRDVYRSGGAEMLVVEGGPPGAFDLPVARPFVRILAPRRGEIVADPEALDLPRPDQLRPPRPPRPPRPRKGEQRASQPPPAPEAPEPRGPGSPEGTPAPEVDPVIVPD